MAPAPARRKKCKRTSYRGITAKLDSEYAGALRKPGVSRKYQKWAMAQGRKVHKDVERFANHNPKRAFDVNNMCKAAKAIIELLKAKGWVPADPRPGKHCPAEIPVYHRKSKQMTKIDLVCANPKDKKVPWRVIEVKTVMSSSKRHLKSYSKISTNTPVTENGNINTKKNRHVSQARIAQKLFCSHFNIPKRKTKAVLIVCCQDGVFAYRG